MQIARIQSATTLVNAGRAIMATELFATVGYFVFKNRTNSDGRIFEHLVRDTCEPACDENAFCSQFGDTYKCQCKTGYTGDGAGCTGGHRKCCEDIKEGKLNTIPAIKHCANATSLCHRRATCSEIPGGYRCSCKEPYAGNGVYFCDRKYRFKLTMQLL